MASKELKKLNRRELLKMLLVQCEETERLQRELNELTSEHEVMSESYERLKNKLNVKDERLNQKDVQIASLKSTIEEMKTSRIIELEEAGNIAEAALKLNGIFEMAQAAADQYLMNVKRYAEAQPKMSVVQTPTEDMGGSEKQIPFESGWRAGIRRKTGSPRTRQITSPGYGQTNPETGQRPEKGTEEDTGYLKASGEIHG